MLYSCVDKTNIHGALFFTGASESLTEIQNALGLFSHRYSVEIATGQKYLREIENARARLATDRAMSFNVRPAESSCRVGDQTHNSWINLGAGKVFQKTKPLDIGFLLSYTSSQSPIR